MKMRAIGSFFEILILPPVVLLTPVSGAGEDRTEHNAFPNKLIFSDTPEIGGKWRGGIRMNDLVVWDANLNINDMFLLDFLFAGVHELDVEDGTITDRFLLFTFKSKPYMQELPYGEIKGGAGFKYYDAETDFITQDSSFEDPWPSDNSLVIFLTQGLTRKRHCFNLFASLSSREKELSSGRIRYQFTFYVTPGYRFGISRRWNFAFENFMTNSEQLPIKVLQYGLDQDKTEFWNPDRNIYSFLIWGFHFTGQHLRIDLNLLNHYSFQGPIVPIIGLGWYF